MKKFYQLDWQDISFAEFFKLSSTSLAGPEFYQAFYDQLFKRYRNWNQLSPTWRKGKESCAEFVLSWTERGKILSVGCGLGYMEHHMYARAPHREIFIHEVAPSAWEWIGKEFPENRKLLGHIPDCLPEGIQFDLIYLSAVDYALDDSNLIALLSSLRPVLEKSENGGRCLLISASFQDLPVTITEKIRFHLRQAKAWGAAIADHLGLRTRGQSWGWTRTQEEYRSIMRRAGYQEIEEGFIDPERRAHYWISGR